MLKRIIVLLFCDLVIAILLFYTAPLTTDEGELGGKTTYRGVAGKGGVDCDAFLASAASCSLAKTMSFSSKTRYSFSPLINKDLMSLNGCTASKVGGLWGRGLCGLDSFVRLLFVYLLILHPFSLPLSLFSLSSSLSLPLSLFLSLSSSLSLPLSLFLSLSSSLSLIVVHYFSSWDQVSWKEPH